MKKSLILLLGFFYITQFLTYSQPTEVGITPGQLDVSLTGAATYTIPIAIPPGVNGVQPDINLNYNSQAANGMAGWGWNISGVSVITRVPATQHHDGRIGNVTFTTGNAGDRFAWDGQRLLRESRASGEYGSDGYKYHTENHSNIRITSHGVSPYGAGYGPAYFEVKYPDGSFARYGQTANSRSRNDYAITYWQNAQGLRISYNYLHNDNNIRIQKISYGARTTSTPTSEIVFTYKTRNRPEQAFVHGATSFSQKYLVDKILVFSNVNQQSVPYRTYELEHDQTSLGYERLVSVTEKSGDGTKSYDPTVFYYEDTNDEGLFDLNTTNINQPWQKNGRNSAVVSGDFSGDGNMGVVFYSTSPNEIRDKYWLYENIQINNVLNPSPVNVGLFQDIFASTVIDPNGKLLSRQGITIRNGSTFKTYIAGNNNPEYQRFWQRPTFQWVQCISGQRAENGNLCEEVPHTSPIPMDYYSGDFNGDGLTDVIAVEKKYIQAIECVQDPPWTLCSANSVNVISRKVHFLNLDRRITSNFANYAGMSVVSFESGKLHIADINGNGKSNILHFYNNTVYTYEFDENNQMQLLSSYNDSAIDIEKQILLGDFNGDGKMDFVIPQAINQTHWNFYFSKADGTFHKENTNLGLYYFDSRCIMGYTTFGCGHLEHEVIEEWQYIAGDFNGDGKSDIIIQKSFSTTNYNCNPDNFGNYPHSMFTDLYFYKNINVQPGNITFDINSSENIRIQNTSRTPIPLFLAHYTPNHNREFGLLSNGYIHTFGTGKNNIKDVLLRRVKNGYGIDQYITYKPLLSGGQTPGSPFKDFAHTWQSPYPFVEPKMAHGFHVVTKLQQEGGGVNKWKYYGYHGAVFNTEGLGFLGFQTTAQTNWHNNQHPMQMSVSKHDPMLRGAMTESFQVLGAVTEYWNYNPSNYISKTINTYESNVSGNKVFRLRNTISEQYNGLTNTKVRAEQTFDTYNNVTERVTKHFEGSNIKQTTTESLEYEHNLDSGTYYVGRPKKKTLSITAYGDTMTGEEQYSYDNAQNLIVFRKKGHDTHFITEINAYDIYGNITQKSISVPAEINTFGPDPGTVTRTTAYEYDNTGRFLTKSTDVEGFETTYTYDIAKGLLLTKTNPFGQTTTYEYDSWGKQTKVTDYLGKSIITDYTIEYGINIAVSKTGDDGSFSKDVFDLLGRKHSQHFKNLQGTSVYITTQYDIYNRPFKVSEPHNYSPSQWTETKYDPYGRPYEIIEHTGKTTNISYNGLTNTINDGYKTITTSIDAMGNTTAHTDPGGTINYTYFANGNLKTANYGGSVQTIEQDGWGQRTKLTDPSAGVYTYTYNGFGEITEETTPKGTTSYTYSDEGRLLEKQVLGDLTDLKTTYTYNTFGQPSYLTVADGVENTLANYQYVYDNHHRPSQIYEDLLHKGISFVKHLEYDSFGRLQNEGFTAMSTGFNGPVSDFTIKHEYQYGHHKRIKNQTDNKILWQANTVNARGQLLTGTLGNGVATSNSYDSFGLPTAINHTYTGSGWTIGSSGPSPDPTGNILKLNYNFNAQKGVLNSRNRSNNWAESFSHDNLNRLTSINSPQGYHSQNYDIRGRVTQKQHTPPGIGTVYEEDLSYLTNNSYQLGSIETSPNSIGSFYYESHPLQQVNYNAFKQPVNLYNQSYINGQTIENRIDFEYNTFGQRSAMYYGSDDSDKVDRPYRKYYSSIAPMEVVLDVNAYTFEFFTYLGGDAYTAPAVRKGNGTDFEILYLHRDYLGSILAITNEDAEIMEERHFSAWGEIAWIKDGNGNNIDRLTVLDRGYTGHEHLQDVKLIHMNGRLYDPILRRFLAPDNFVQDPYNTQNFNRYGYVLNNPLVYNDPSGEIINVLIGAAIGVIVNGINNSIHNVGFFKGAIGAAFYGMVGGAMSGYIGNIATTISASNATAAVVFQVAAHGVSGGGISYAQGGSFGSGFAAGALSSAVGSGAGSAAKNLNKTWTGVVQIGAGSVAGGAGSVIAGGNFWDGLRQGAITAALNHFAHRIKQAVTVRSLLHKAGIDPKGIPFFSVYEAYLVADALEMYNDAGRPEFEIEKNLVDSDGDPAHGLTEAIYIGDKLSSLKIKLSNTAYRNYYQLASTIVHELAHAIDHFRGDYKRWEKSRGSKYADYRTEYNAYTLQFKMQASMNWNLYFYYRKWHLNSP